VADQRQEKRENGSTAAGEECRLWQCLAVLVAQGFGIGRIPIAPGTFGSVLGVLWFMLLLWSGSLWVLAGGAVVGFALSVWLCGIAEKRLGKRDPGSVVLDEITAIPVCFFSWVGIRLFETNSLPIPGRFFSTPELLWLLGIFAAFRFFDVVKPWPVRQSQSLPGGWGITVDDFLAALYVNAVVIAIHGVGLSIK
jgi:phosphatidylglycerophosphatase A